MKINDLLKEIGIPSLESANYKFNELKEQFIEMGQLKSDFDIEKYTVMKQGKFIAHQFHFLMRQYVFAQSEMRRMLIEKERKQRKIKKLKKEQPEDYDLDIMNLENELDLLDVTMVNKIMMCLRFEQARKQIIKNNNGKVPTNEDHQKEEPEYWKWFIQQKAKEQLSQAKTGIHEGTWEVIRQLQEDALINPSYKLNLLNDEGILLLDDK